MRPTPNHLLTLSIGPDGIVPDLWCPHAADAAHGVTWPDPATRPACRLFSPAACAAEAMLTMPDGCEVWHGPAVPVEGPVPIRVWRDGTALRLGAAGQPVQAPEPEPTVEDMALVLAEASGSPRYAGDGWRMLLEEDTNCQHALTCALRNAARTVPDAHLAAIRGRLGEWHRAKAGAPTQTASTA